MLVNKKNKTGRVKFISYTGKYPCLCSGVLTLEIDGVQYKFGHNCSACHYHEDTKVWVQEDEDPKNPNFESFWSSGGDVEQDSRNNWKTTTNEWRIFVDELPEQFKDLAAEIDEVFNDNVEYGCCGGCS